MTTVCKREKSGIIREYEKFIKHFSYGFYKNASSLYYE